MVWLAGIESATLRKFVMWIGSHSVTVETLNETWVTQLSDRVLDGPQRPRCIAGWAQYLGLLMMLSMK